MVFEGELSFAVLDTTHGCTFLWDEQPGNKTISNAYGIKSVGALWYPEPLLASIGAPQNKMGSHIQEAALKEDQDVFFLQGLFSCHSSTQQKCL